MPKVSTAALVKVRRICLALPDTSERLSHGAPTFFIREKRSFVTFMDDHHGDGRLAIWCAAPPGAQRTLASARPEHFFLPPYVAHLDWLGVRLDRDLSWDEVGRVIQDAYATVSPRVPRGRTAR
jgi:hypothetical protein